MIAAVGLDGVRSRWRSSGASNAATFLGGIARRGGARPPLRGRGDLVVFDNLASHFTPGVAEAIERAGATVFPLPPYSPDFNPIRGDVLEAQGSSSVMRRARTRDSLYDALGEALKLVSAEDILGWFRQAGLCASQG